MSSVVEEGEKALFPEIKNDHELLDQIRKVQIPPNRLTPLKSNWLKIFTPLVEQLHLQVRFNPKTKNVELRHSPLHPPKSASGNTLQRACDFIHAFALGFEVADALVMLKLEDIYVDSFEIKDVKTLNGDHLSRAIGRLAGRGGKTKNTIENTSRTRIILADSKIHIMGSFRNIRVAKDAICALIMGSTPGTVYNRLRNIAARMNERR